jgi:hypothetical protein
MKKPAITVDILSKSPVLLAFLMQCQLRQSNKHKMQIFVMTPKNTSYLAVKDFLGEFLDFLPKGGAIINFSNLITVQEAVDKAKVQYINKVLYDITSSVAKVLPDQAKNLKASVENNKLTLKYKDVEFASHLDFVDIFQEELSTFIIHNICSYITAFEKVKQLEEASSALSYQYGKFVGFSSMDISASFAFGDTLAEFNTFKNNCDEAVSNIITLNQNIELIKQCFEGVEIKSLEVGFESYSLIFNNPNKPTKNTISKSPVRNIKSDAYRVKQMIKVTA